MRSGLLIAALLLLANACTSSGSPKGGQGVAGSGPDGGGDGPGSAGKGTHEPDAQAPEAGAPPEADGGSPTDDPGMPGAGAPSGETGGTGGLGGTGGSSSQADPTEPGYPFDLGQAAAALGQNVDPQFESLDARTVEFTLAGSTLSAILDRTEWSTAPEAEFECSRSGGSLVVGPDRVLFVASDAVWLASGLACTKVRVLQGSTYSATLTRSFAQTVLGAP